MGQNLEDSLPDVVSRPVRRSFLEPKRQGEVRSLNNGRSRDDDDDYELTQLLSSLRTPSISSELRPIAQKRARDKTEAL